MTRMFPINPTIMTIPNTKGTKRLVSMFNSSYQSSVLFSDRPGMLTVTENGDLQRSAALAVVLVYWLETERAGPTGWRTGIIISSNFVIKRKSKSYAGLGAITLTHSLSHPSQLFFSLYILFLVNISRLCFVTFFLSVTPQWKLLRSFSI